MTAKFVAAYKAGKDDEARALYPVARMHWEHQTVWSHSAIWIPSRPSGGRSRARSEVDRLASP